jgi:L-lactate dehydrogenase complex protein LldE
MSQAEGRPYPAKPEEVYFFGTCLVDTIYPQAGLAAVELIEREGVKVIYPQDQTCCGQPPFNSGYREEAREVAAAQMALFPKPIPVVVPSGSCGAMLHVHYPHLFDGDDEATARARAFSERVYEWSDFMVNVLNVRLKDSGAPLKVTYHPSCHLLREMGVREPPLELLRQLSQVELVPLPDAEECCGFGGAFSVKQSAISWAMVEDKRQAVAESGAEVLVAVDCGCLMNIGGAMAKAGQSAQVKPLPLFLKERSDDSQS